VIQSGLRILVIDDEVGARDALRDLLREQGHQVTTARSGEEALPLFREQPYPLVLVGLRLLGMSAMETLDGLKRIAPDTEVIIIASHLSLGYAISALRAGASDYLTKPFDDRAATLGVINRRIDKIRLVNDNRLLVSRLQTHNLELEQLNGVLQDLVVRDGLTGLYNHRFFYEAINIEHARARRHNRHYSVMFIDVDHFRDYNDRYGHLRGDELLRDLAEIVMSRLRHSDVAARYGGEEFALILPETPKLGARALAEDIRICVGANRFTSRADEAVSPITISVGLASFPDDGDCPEAIVQAADRALYRAKHSGRNVVHWLEDGRRSDSGGSAQRP